MTQPPCAEFTTWIIANDRPALSSTIISMFRDSLMDPNKQGNGVRFNMGNNRIT